MRFYSSTSLRVNPLDRNPTTIQVGANATVLQGSATTLATYTVPSGRRALFGVVDGSLIVTVVLAAGAIATLEVDITPSGGGAQVAARRETVAAAAPGDHRELTWGALQLKAGDQILIQATTGAGGAGATHASGELQGVEYDA